MQRRSFLKAGSLAGLAATTIVSSSCNLFTGEKNEQNAEEYADQFELNEATISILQDKMLNKEYTSRSITELYLKRIEKIDKAGPKLNAVIQLNPDALSIADAMDKERANGKVRGPLHGIPVLIKDNIDTGT
ncbi:MAG: amidase family protein [Mucilaginibacter sp.]